MSQSSLPLEPVKAKAPGGAAALVVALGRSTAAMLVLSGIGFLILWQVVSMNVSPVILPEPVAVITAFIALTASGELVNATLATIWPVHDHLGRQLRSLAAHLSSPAALEAWCQALVQLRVSCWHISWP